jgi:hypothetical protein
MQKWRNGMRPFLAKLMIGQAARCNNKLTFDIPKGAKKHLLGVGS